MGMLLRRHREAEINRRRDVKITPSEEIPQTESEGDSSVAIMENGKRKRKTVNLTAEDSALSE